MNSKKKIIYSIILLLFIPILTANCTFSYKQPIHKVNLPQTKDRLKLSINLVITEELQNAKWKDRYGFDTYKAPLGENIVHHTEMLARNVFEKVTVTNNPSVDLLYSKESYVLIPKVISIDHVKGPLIFSLTKTSIIMEWRILNGSGRLIWLETITGSSSGKLREPIPEENLKQALIDLFLKSQEEFLSSKLLSNLQTEELQKTTDTQSLDHAKIGREKLSTKKVAILIPTTDQIKLAILPFHLYKGGARYGGPIEEPTVQAICQALKNNNKFFPTFSYYKLGDEFGAKSIDENFISINSSGELWNDKLFSRKIPNIELAREIGKKLGVDVLLLVSVVTSSYGSYDVVFYLIDTDDHTVYKRSDKIHTSRFDANILSFTKIYFSGYREVD